MSRVDFVIANDGHHSQAALPVLRRLQQTGRHRCRVLSLCELRGLRSPVERYAEEGISLRRLVPFRIRSSPASGRPTGAGRADRARSVARHLFWLLLLRWTVSRVLAKRPTLVVVPNDGAFPYDRLCRWLAARGIRSLVLQEGIRFPIPGENRPDAGTATDFAVWGPTSRDYYLSRGAPAERTYATGAPRLDEIIQTNWSRDAADLHARLRLGERTLLFLSNPIDDMGYVTPEGKTRLIRDFVAAQTAFLEQPDATLVVKLHPRESSAEIEGALSGLPLASSVRVVRDVPLYPLLALARGAVTFASTVGLEALLLDLRLAILELPGHGFAHDFVSSGVATPLEWDADLGAQIGDWLERPPPARAVSLYLDRTLVNRGSAARAVFRLVERLVSNPETRPESTRAAHSRKRAG